MDRGYVKLYRKSLDSGIIQHARAWQFLSWCLLSATHKPYRRMFNNTLFELEPGQLVSSGGEACAALGLTPKEFRVVVKLLEGSGFLTSRGTHAGTVFSIQNWQQYQQEAPLGDAPAGRAGGQAEGARRARSARARSQDKQEVSSLSPLIPPSTSSGSKPASDPDGKACSGTNSGTGSRTGSRAVSAKGATGNTRAEMGTVIEAYTDDADLRRALEDFRVMRERNRRPMTGRALELLFSDLETLCGESVPMKTAVLEQSILNGWQGVYPLKGPNYTVGRKHAAGSGYASPAERRLEGNLRAAETFVGGGADAFGGSAGA